MLGGRSERIVYGMRNWLDGFGDGNWRKSE